MKRSLFSICAAFLRFRVEVDAWPVEVAKITRDDFLSFVWGQPATQARRTSSDARSSPLRRLSARRRSPTQTATVPANYSVSPRRRSSPSASASGGVAAARGCPPGMSSFGSNATGADNCYMCPVGKFSDMGWTCDDCPNGTFSNEIGASACGHGHGSGCTRDTLWACQDEMTCNALDGAMWTCDYTPPPSVDYWSPTPPPALCPTDGSNCVTSPNYPSNYADYSSCTYKFGGSPGYVTDFETESCCDSLLIDDTSYTGTDGMMKYVKPYAYISWQADGSLSQKGWRICEGSMVPTPAPTTATCPTDTSNCVTSPNYPSVYPDLYSCTYTFGGSPGVVVDFNTESFFDTLTLNNLSLSGTEGIMGQYVEPYSAILFSSDSGGSQKGWKICEGDATWTPYPTPPPGCESWCWSYWDCDMYKPECGLCSMCQVEPVANYSTTAWPIMDGGLIGLTPLPTPAWPIFDGGILPPLEPAPVMDGPPPFTPAPVMDGPPPVMPPIADGMGGPPLTTSMMPPLMDGVAPQPVPVITCYSDYDCTSMGGYYCATSGYCVMEAGVPCTLQCGTVVQNGWSGPDEGSNMCNTCECMEGSLVCTEIGCLPNPCPAPAPAGWWDTAPAPAGWWETPAPDWNMAPTSMGVATPWPAVAPTSMGVATPWPPAPAPFVDPWTTTPWPMPTGMCSCRSQCWEGQIWIETYGYCVYCSGESPYACPDEESCISVGAVWFEENGYQSCERCDANYVYGCRTQESCEAIGATFTCSDGGEYCNCQFCDQYNPQVCDRAGCDALTLDSWRNGTVIWDEDQNQCMICSPTDLWGCPDEDSCTNAGGTLRCIDMMGNGGTLQTCRCERCEAWSLAACTEQECSDMVSMIPSIQVVDGKCVACDGYSYNFQGCMDKESCEDDPASVFTWVKNRCVAYQGRDDSIMGEPYPFPRAVQFEDEMYRGLYEFLTRNTYVFFDLYPAESMCGTLAQVERCQSSPVGSCLPPCSNVGSGCSLQITSEVITLQDNVFADYVTKLSECTMMTTEDCTGDCEPGVSRIFQWNQGEVICVPKTSWQLDYLSSIGEGESIFAGIVAQDKFCLDGAKSGMDCDSIEGCEFEEDLGFCATSSDHIGILAAPKYPELMAAGETCASLAEDPMACMGRSECRYEWLYWEGSGECNLRDSVILSAIHGANFDYTSLESACEAVAKDSWDGASLCSEIPGCIWADDHECRPHFKELYKMSCGIAPTPMPPTPMPPPPTPQPPAECDSCVESFDTFGGCTYLTSGMDVPSWVMSMLPSGCDACGDAAGMYCMGETAPSDDGACGPNDLSIINGMGGVEAIVEDPMAIEMMWGELSSSCTSCLVMPMNDGCGLNVQEAPSDDGACGPNDLSVINGMGGVEALVEDPMAIEMVWGELSSSCTSCLAMPMNDGCGLNVQECTVEIAEVNPLCPVAACQDPGSGCLTKKELDPFLMDMCCLKACNYVCPEATTKPANSRKRKSSTKTRKRKRAPSTPAPPRARKRKSSKTRKAKKTSRKRRR